MTKLEWRSHYTLDQYQHCTSECALKSQQTTSLAVPSWQNLQETFAVLAFIYLQNCLTLTFLFSNHMSSCTFQMITSKHTCSCNSKRVFLLMLESTVCLVVYVNCSFLAIRYSTLYLTVACKNRMLLLNLHQMSIQLKRKTSAIIPSS